MSALLWLVTTENIDELVTWCIFGSRNTQFIDTEKARKRRLGITKKVADFDRTYETTV